MSINRNDESAKFERIEKLRKIHDAPGLEQLVQSINAVETRLQSIDITQLPEATPTQATKKNNLMREKQRLEGLLSQMDIPQLKHLNETMKEIDRNKIELEHAVNLKQVDDAAFKTMGRWSNASEKNALIDGIAAIESNVRRLEQFVKNEQIANQKNIRDAQKGSSLFKNGLFSHKKDQVKPEKIESNQKISFKPK